jgi:parvulin-like peptidyl-prolyl isomerase
MAKKKQPQESQSPTRRQVARSRKEQEQQKLLFMGLGLVGGLILLVLAIGLVQTYILEPNAPVVTVNGQQISTTDYQNRVKYERFVLEDQYQRIVTEVQSFPEPQEGDQFTEMLINQYQQLAGQVLQQRSLVDRQTVDDMTLDILVQAEAEKRGISVTEEEVTESINRLLAGRQGGLTAASAQETATAQAEASATAALWTPTPTFTPSPTLTTTEALTQPTPTPANTPTPAPTSTPNIIGENTLSADYAAWIETVNQQTGLSEAQYREYVRTNLLATKLGEVLGKEAPTSAEQANARHILVETEEEAAAVLERLNSGESFAALAEELSLDTGSAPNGGELGFVPRGRFVEPVEEAIFSQPISEIGNPVESQFGWHIIEVLEREERELSPADYLQEQRAAYSDWVTTARQEATIEDVWTPDKAPPDPFMEQFQQQP